MVPLKIDNKQPWKTVYEVIGDDYFEQSDVKVPRKFLLKCKKEFNVSHFIPVKV